LNESFNSKEVLQESTKGTENVDDLDINLNLMSRPMIKKRLYLLDPSMWKFDVEEAKKTIKSQTDSNQSNEMVTNGSVNTLCLVLTKLWWEEYIPFDLFNNLTYEEK
jgi:hypothetical protein